MKTKLYYVIPFVAVPLLLLLCDTLHNMNLLSMNVYILSALLLLFSVVIGFFSTTHRTFDYWLTALVPLALFCCMFVIGFLDKTDMETRFHLYKAVRTAFQPFALQLYVFMAIATFVASFTRFRNIKKRISKR